MNNSSTENGYLWASKFSESDRLALETLRVLRRLQRSYQLECYVIEVLPAERGYLRHEAQTLIDAIKYGGILPLGRSTITEIPIFEIESTVETLGVCIYDPV